MRSRAVGLREATHGPVSGQEAVLQVDDGLSDPLIFREHVVVI